MTDESNLQKKVVDYLNEHGKAIVITISEYIETGTPDILACVEGRFIAVETKSPEVRAEPSTIQEWRMKEWEDAGALVMCVNDLETVKERIEIELVADVG